MRVYPTAPSEIKMEEIPGQIRNLELSEKNKANRR
jgi:hypothetical protein